MANAHFKTALTHAGLTVEEFADIIRVDPKTVQRWVAGRTPYARHRGTISRALDIPEHELWPDTVDAPAPLTVAENPVLLGNMPGIRAWAHTNDTGAPNPIALLSDLNQEVDLVDPTGDLLNQPGVLPALQNLLASCCQVRVITASLVPGQAWLKAFQELGLRSIENLARGHIVLRADDTMLLALPLRDEQSPPLFALDRAQAVDVFDRFAAHVDRLWDTATPVIHTAVPTPPVDPNTAEPSEPPRWPRQPN